MIWEASTWHQTKFDYKVIESIEQLYINITVIERAIKLANINSELLSSMKKFFGQPLK
jgi:hypothetical protein